MYVSDVETILFSASIHPRNFTPSFTTALNTTPSVRVAETVAPLSIAFPPAVTLPKELSKLTVTLEASLATTSSKLLSVKVAVVFDKPLLDIKVIDKDAPASNKTL